MHGREPMSKVDTAWLRMESTSQPMMITGVMVLAQRLELKRFKQLLRARFLKFERFRQRVLDLGAQAFWELDADFDVDRHVHRLELAGAGTQAALQQAVSALASTPLDFSRPLWSFHLIERYAGGSALVVRIHHCYADGIALVRVLLALTDRDGSVREEPSASVAPAAPGDLIERFWAPARQGVSQLSALFDGALKKAIEFSEAPQAVAEALKAKAQSGLHSVGEFARELGAALALSDDPDTPLKGRLGTRKQVAWSAPLPLDEVKLVARAFGATANDVLMACASGVLRTHLLDAGADLADVSIRASVPVNLRKGDAAEALGNQFGLVFVDLPVGLSSPLARLAAVSAAMRMGKGSRQAEVTFGLLKALGMAPAAMQKPAFEMLSRKASVVATNVPGPVRPRFLAGARIEEMLFWVPQTGTIGVGLSLLSYAGRVYFGIMADANLVPDPAPLAREFARELEKLVLITLMSDPEEIFTELRGSTELRKFAAVRPDDVKMEAGVQRTGPKVAPRSTTPTRRRSRNEPGSVR